MQNLMTLCDHRNLAWAAFKKRSSSSFCVRAEHIWGQCHLLSIRAQNQTQHLSDYAYENEENKVQQSLVDILHTLSEDMQEMDWGVHVSGSTRLTEGLDELLHGQHPGHSQMAVLEEDPVAGFHRCLYHLLCQRPLALTQWDGLHSEKQREIEIPLGSPVDTCLHRLLLKKKSSFKRLVSQTIYLVKLL